MSSFFQPDEEQCIELFLNNAVNGKKFALQLKQKLWDRLIINDSTTVAYLQSQTSVGFMTALFNTLSLKLPRNVEDSNYGGGIFSDFQVLHNFGNQKSRDAFMSENPEFKSLSVGTINDIIKSSTKLRRWLLGQRTNLISHWDLPEGDLPIREPKKRAVKTVELVQKEAEEQLEATSYDNSVTEYNKLVGEVNKEQGTEHKVITRSQKNSQSAAGAGPSEKKAKKMDKSPESQHSMMSSSSSYEIVKPPLTVARLMEVIPSLLSDGALIRFDLSEGVIHYKDFPSGDEKNLEIADAFNEYSL